MSNTIKIKNHEARELRKRKTAEIFTPPELTNQMIDKLCEYDETGIMTNPFKTIIDPACGNGNMLVVAMLRRLQSTKPCTIDHEDNVFIVTEPDIPLILANSFYGCDINRDNVEECRLRLLKVILENSDFKMHIISIIKALHKNIVCTPLDKYPKGSLDYLSLPASKTFQPAMTDKQAKEYLDKVDKEELLKQV